MADYTTNTGIIKPTAGEYPNTWGAKANVNFDIFDRALGGRATITKASGGANVYGVDYPVTLAVSDGALSDGQYPAIEYADDGDLGADLYVQLTPADAKRTITFKNSLTNDRNLVVYQGEYNAGRAYTVANGYDATLVFSGGGSTAATATRLIEKQVFSEVETSTLGTAAQAALVNLVYPVGSIYISAVDTSPATLFGVGTWVRFAEGKTLFSQSGSITALDTAEETGGSVTIAANNLPEHAHGSGSLTGTTASAGGHTHTVTDSYVVTSPTTGGDRGYTGFASNSTTTRTTSTAGAHTHSVSITSGSTAVNTTTAADYYPPYVVVYMWKRTA